jgi:hypothetical protein
MSVTVSKFRSLTMGGTTITVSRTVDLVAPEDSFEYMTESALDPELAAARTAAGNCLVCADHTVEGSAYCAPCGDVVEATQY